MSAVVDKIRNILTNTYSAENYFGLMTEVLDGMKAIDPYNQKKEFSNFSSHIEGYTHTGTYTSPDKKKIIVMAVELKNKTYVENSRSTQRSYAKNLIANASADAALIAFHTTGETRWRLSFVRLDYEVKIESGKLKAAESITPAKRYSFLVGKDEPCHTAVERFRLFIDHHASNPTLDELEDAFSVETVTKEFFEYYREKFFQLRDCLESNESFLREANLRNFSSAQFAKKLMGQIVFLYFLQKKGWLGVSAWPKKMTAVEYRKAFYARSSRSCELIPTVYQQVDENTYQINVAALNRLSDEEEKFLSTCVKGEPWGTGPRNFMRKLFETAVKKGENFFEAYLEPLFYEALNINRGEQGYDPALHCRIPFLSGGLFEPLDGYEWKHNNFNIPNELFSNKAKDNDRLADGILDIFDRYNFTMSEDEPLEREVAIDPEMLGKVFENLLDVNDRKSKGAFYTPREIVHYMCRESLINYLTTAMKVSETSIRDFILYGDFMKDDDAGVLKRAERGESCELWISEELFLLGTDGTIKADRMAELDKVLLDVRVADPAVGSGAFPLGMLNEIVRARQNITTYMDISLKIRDPKGAATEIRYRRLNERSARQLKYDTIRNCIFAVDIEPSAVDIAQLRLWLALVIDDEIDPDAVTALDGHRNPLPLPNLECNILCGNSLIDQFEGFKLVNESKLLGNTTDSQINIYQSAFDSTLMRLISKQEELYKCDNTDTKASLLQEIHDLRNGVIMTQLAGAPADVLEKYEETKTMASQPFILWQLDFAKVFREKGGFDIVIGNPPYVNIVNLTTDYRNYLQNHYIITKNKVDLYAYFIEMSEKIIHDDSQISFIIPQTWKATDSFEKLRVFIFSRFKMLQLVNLEMGTFEAVVRPLIILLQKQAKIQKYQILIRDKDFKTIDTIAIDEILASSTMSIDTESSKQDKKLFARIEKVADFLLGDVLQFTRGIKTSNDKRFIVDNKIDDNCKIVYRGKNIKAYELNWKGEYIWYRPDLMREKVGCLPHNRERFEVKEKIVTQRVNSSMQLLVAYDNQQSYFLDTVNVSKPETLRDGFSLKYILALLNSKLINYWYCYKYRMPTVGLYELHTIPVRKPNKDVQERIIDLVDNVLKGKVENKEIREYTDEINELVFDTYGLTRDEKEYIEGRI